MIRKPDIEKLKKYSKHFTDEQFWEKVKECAIIVGREGLRQVLTLFYVLKRPDVPAWAKGVILGTLGYFIFPIDLIPDLIPLIGYADDLSALAAAAGMVAMYIDDEVRQKADHKLKEWFGTEKNEE